VAIPISQRKEPKTGKSWKFRHLDKKEGQYIYPHYHCAKCDALIEVGNEFTKRQIKQRNYPGYDYFCSAKCAEVSLKEEKSRKRTKYLWLLLLVPAVFILLWFLLSP